ncbi:hypothetical protein PanWU01x14_277990 [Parasponia andersonii]|uniref:Uncharacterized protein n=1 Tax=Parasponia andersonii TaxID=3476 RepID=A0A2P5B290_PARAD|nr:hypothetical protein PanWU01x14_277990 [Parasponia andersonii]
MGHGIHRWWQRNATMEPKIMMVRRLAKMRAHNTKGESLKEGISMALVYFPPAFLQWTYLSSLWQSFYRDPVALESINLAAVDFMKLSDVCIYIYIYMRVCEYIFLSLLSCFGVSASLDIK